MDLAKLPETMSTPELIEETRQLRREMAALELDLADALSALLLGVYANADEVTKAEIHEKCVEDLYKSRMSYRDQMAQAGMAKFLMEIPGFSTPKTE